MPLDFPSSPSVNDTYSYGGTTWIWDGSAWYVQPPASINNTPIGNITPSTGAFTTLSSTGNTTLGNINANLIPAANVTYNLGSNTARWNDIWLANSTIHIGDANISAAGANLLLPSTVYIGNTAMTETGGILALPAGTANVSPGTPVDVPKITSVQITDSSWNVLDDTSVSTSGGYIVINGSNFVSGCIVDVGTLQASSVSFVSSSVLRCQIPAQSAGTYNVFVINPDGGTAVRVNGVTYSAAPTWLTPSTLPTEAEDVPIYIQLVATEGSKNITYALQAGSSLPSGVTLSSSGLISGTVTGISVDTTYNFTIEAIDTDLQESPRAFSMTVTLGNLPGRIYTWGTGLSGLLGLNSSIYRSSPTQVGTDTTWRLVTAGNYHMGGIETDGTLWAWAANGVGQLGLNDTISRSSPTQIGSSTDWATLSLGGSAATAGSSFAIKTNGTLWGWGTNLNGQLGLSDVVSLSSPVQVGIDSNWMRVQTGSKSTAAIKTDGTLWVWGDNTNGKLGLNDRVSRSSPVQLGTDTDWNSVVNGTPAAGSSMLALKRNGSIWSWGQNNSGQLGLNSTVYRSSPVQIDNNYNWNNIYGDGTTFIVTKTDGTLWGWGSAFSGRLGINSTINRSSPVQIGTDTNWAIISTATSTTLAIRSNGTLWAWGSNVNGSLGLNNTIARSSPVQLGTGTNWNQIATAYFSGIALEKV